MDAIELLKLQFSNFDANEPSHFMLFEGQTEEIRNWLKENCKQVNLHEWVYEKTWHIITLYEDEVFIAKSQKDFCKASIYYWEKASGRN